MKSIRTACLALAVMLLFGAGLVVLNVIGFGYTMR